ncbi:MAG: helix-turn-helix domain-containing protein [Thermoanaerobaculia bacterium]
MGTLERRGREKAERKRQILKAARKLFWKNGFARTTMPAIAEAAELSAGTLYLYFPSKHALYAELLDEGFDLLESRLREAVAKGRAPRKSAEALVDAFLGFAREAPDYFDVLFFTLQEPGREMQVLREGRDVMTRLDRRQEACKAVAAGVLRQARPALGAEELARSVDALWSMLAGVVLYFLRDEPATFAAVAARARSVILRGILGRE